MKWPPQWTLKTLLIMVAAAAVALGLTRWSLALSLLFLEAIGASPIYAAKPDDRLGEAGLAYAFGVFGPTLCLIFDPVIFQGGDENGPILGSFRTFAYSFIGIEMTAFALWLLAGPALGRASGVLSGIMGMGSAFAAGTGVLILPFTLLGLLVGIGIFGFIPFGTARTFFLQSRAAADATRVSFPRPRVRMLQLAGAALAIGIPVLMQSTCDMPELFRFGFGNLDDALGGK